MNPLHCTDTYLLCIQLQGLLKDIQYSPNEVNAAPDWQPVNHVRRRYELYPLKCG